MAALKEHSRVHVPKAIVEFKYKTTNTAILLLLYDATIPPRPLRQGGNTDLLQTLSDIHPALKSFFILVSFTCEIELKVDDTYWRVSGPSVNVGGSEPRCTTAPRAKRGVGGDAEIPPILLWGVFYKPA